MAKKNDASGIAFVTNQELTLSQRKELTNGAGAFKVELFHIERLTAILDQPRLANVRKQFLSLEAASGIVEDKWVGSSTSPSQDWKGSCTRRGIV